MIKCPADFRRPFRAIAARDSLTQAKALYVFSVVCGPKGHESIAQGLPWVIPPTELALKGLGA